MTLGVSPGLGSTGCRPAMVRAYERSLQVFWMKVTHWAEWMEGVKKKQGLTLIWAVARSLYCVFGSRPQRCRDPTRQSPPHGYSNRWELLTRLKAVKQWPLTNTHVTVAVVRLELSFVYLPQAPQVTSGGCMTPSPSNFSQHHKINFRKFKAR